MKMMVTNSDVEIQKLEGAPWNPRPVITDESVKDLAASIKADGLLQNIGVWRDDANGGRMIVVYGNRRFQACLTLGWHTIPAKVYSGCGEDVARKLTRIENEIRLGVDPLEDAKLLKSMRDMGFSETEMSAHFGVPVSTVCRRLKLCDLDEGVLKFVADGHHLTTDALERIAAYPEDVQKDAVKNMGRAYWGAEETKPWSAVRYIFDELTRDLERLSFPDCRACFDRTGATPDLFGDCEAGKLGRCLNPTCHKRHCDDTVARKLEKLVRKGCKKVKVKNEWQLDNGDMLKKPDDAHPVAYYLVKPDLTVSVRYGEEKKKNQKAADNTVDEKEEERMAKRFDELRKAFEEWIKAHLVDELLKYVGDDARRIVDLLLAFEDIPLWEVDGRKLFDAWRSERTVAAFFDNGGRKLLENLSKETYWTAPQIDETIELFGDSVDWKSVLGDDYAELLKKRLEE